MEESYSWMDEKGISSSEPFQQLLFIMIHLGIQSHTAKCLICLHLHGPSSSISLQKNCKIRQSDVSVAITELRRLEVVKSVPRLPPAVEGRRMFTNSQVRLKNVSFHFSQKPRIRSQLLFQRSQRLKVYAKGKI